MGLLESLPIPPPMRNALTVQREVLNDFHARAARILGSTCPLRPYSENDLSLNRNLFSVLFLSVEHAAGVRAERLRFFGLLNQCMRAWVTACDNLFDDESKEVIPFDLPGAGHRFPAVLTIMTADRVLAELLEEECRAGRLRLEDSRRLSHITLRVLLPSGLQEHEEQSGRGLSPDPEALLQDVHVRKTGLLFEAPLALAEAAGDVAAKPGASAKAGLRAFGLACQILDDIVDLEDDIRKRRLNYVLALALRGRSSDGDAGEAELLALPLDAARRAAKERALALFGDARAQLDETGLRVDDGAWRALLSAVLAQLRVPEALRFP